MGEGTSTRRGFVAQAPPNGHVEWPHCGEKTDRSTSICRGRVRSCRSGSGRPDSRFKYGYQKDEGEEAEEARLSDPCLQGAEEEQEGGADEGNGEEDLRSEEEAEEGRQEASRSEVEEGRADTGRGPAAEDLR
jgi:hypothetical protein